MSSKAEPGTYQVKVVAVDFTGRIKPVITHCITASEENMVKKLVYLLVASIIGSFLFRSLNHAYLVKEIELMKEAFSAA